MSNIVNQTPFLRTSRNFPEELKQLSVECTKAYIDTANAVNARTISQFTTNRPIQNGENWYLSGNSRQQAFQRVYQYTASGSIPHGLTLTQLYAFVRIYGAFTDGTKWYPLPYVNVNSINNQVLVNVDGTNIVITSGASGPVISQGTVVLVWLSNP